MKKTLITLACIFVLCALIGESIQILRIKPALADPTDLVVQPPVEVFGDAASDPTLLLPAGIRQAYNLPASGGDGTIAIVAAYDDPTILSDVNNFSSYFGLPLLENNTTFEKHKMAQSISTNENWSMEISLDVEWAHAIAPNAKILLVEALNNTIGYSDGTPGPLLDAVDYARNRTDVVSISMSWSMNENAIELSFDSHFISSNGAIFFAASGDHSENVSYPACSPSVVGVGGTTLTFANGSLISETVWNKTGGGISHYETEPSYQVSYGVQGSSGHRSVPDVSFDAGTGVFVYNSNPYQNSTGPGWSVGGTSLGTPCWAAINSLNRTASNPRLYAIGKSVYNPSSLRDIITGTNGNYNATTGYDFCTGLGSPITSSFASLLPGDVNLDGHVNVYDAIELATAFGTKKGDSLFNPYADINNDNKVDIFDAIILANHFDQSYTSGSGLGALGYPPSGGALTQGGATILVNPSQTVAFKDEVFTVNVEVTDVTDLLGWQFKLYWNSSVLNCTSARVQSPSQWENYTQDYGTGLENSYNATHGRFFKAETAAHPAPSFNGSMTIVTLTFQAMQPGTTSLTLVETELGNSTAQPIHHTDSGGSVTVYYSRYMRSDAATINGLNANLLNATETTSYTYAQQIGQGLGASFGIRAWIRASNGTEYEITLDGQTGTPKATVTQTDWGTVNATQIPMETTFSLVIRVYVSIAGGPWTNKATFTTEQLGKTSLLGTTWSVYYYVSESYNAKLDRTTAKFYWGDASHMSQMQNLQFN